MATQEQKQALTALYVGYYDRAPDPDGLQFWIDQIDNGREFSTIAADFAAAPEALAKYPYLSTPDVSTPSTFITSIYLNLFGRTPDQAGLDFWTGVLNDGSVSVAEMIEEIIMGAVNDEDAGTFDKTVLDNKIEVGLDFAESTADVSGFEFDADAKMAAEAAVNGVTEDPATVEAAKAATDAYLAGETNQGDTLTLTTGVDSITGTAMNDSLPNGIVGAATDNATFTNGDVIDGGAGTDSMNITVVEDANWPVAATVSNVENVFVRSLDAGNLSFANFSGVEQLWSKNSLQGLQVIDLQNNVTLGLDSTTQNFAAAFGAGKVGSATSTLNVATKGSTSTLTVNTDGTDVFTKAAISSTGVKSAVTVAAGAGDVALKELSVSGDAALNLKAGTNVALTGLTKVDASAMTAGGLTVDLTGNATGTTKLAFTGSAGNDTVTFASGNLSTDMTLKGGAGTDVLAVTGNNAADSTLVSGTVGAKVSEFEVLRAEALTLDDDVDLTVDGTAIAGLNEVQLQAMTGTAGLGASTVNVTNLDSGDKVTFLGNQGTDLTNTLSFKATTLTETTRAMTVELGDGAGVDGVKNGVTVASLNVAKATDLTVNSVGGANTVSAQTTTDLKALTVTGDKQVTFTTAVEGANLATIDASGMTMANATDAGLTMGDHSSDVATGGLTITGSKGVDVIYGSDEAGSKTTINASAGNDTIELDNNSQDTIVITDLVAQLGKTTTTTDTVNGFDVTADVLDFNGITFAGTFSVGGAAFAGGGNSSAYVDGNNDLAIDNDGDGQIDALIVGTFNGITAGNFDIA